MRPSRPSSRASPRESLGRSPIEPWGACTPNRPAVAPLWLLQQGRGVGVPAAAAAHGADRAQHDQRAVLPPHLQDAQGAAAACRACLTDPQQRPARMPWATCPLVSCTLATLLLDWEHSPWSGPPACRPGRISACPLRHPALHCRATTTAATSRTRWCPRPPAGAPRPSRCTGARESSATAGTPRPWHARRARHHSVHPAAAQALAPSPRPAHPDAPRPAVPPQAGRLALHRALRGSGRAQRHPDGRQRRRILLGGPLQARRRRGTRLGSGACVCGDAGVGYGVVCGVCGCVVVVGGGHRRASAMRRTQRWRRWSSAPAPVPG